MCMMRELKTTNVITTVHTVHRNYPEHNHGYIQQLTLLSRKLVVMTHSMRHILSAFHGIPTKYVAVIPHGGVDATYDRKDGTHRQSIFPGKKVILSNGLIHQMKGLEFLIYAMPKILEAVPNAVYYIHGKPHPTGYQTKEYYDWIKGEANLTTPSAIFFNESFASDEDLFEILRNTRVYVNPYIDVEQSVSGTLAMALSLGTVSISTPYAYALEMLAGYEPATYFFHSILPGKPSFPSSVPQAPARNILFLL